LVLPASDAARGGWSHSADCVGPTPAPNQPPPPTSAPAVPSSQPTPQVANPQVWSIELNSSTGLADVIGAPRVAELPPGDVRVVVHWYAPASAGPPATPPAHGPVRAHAQPLDGDPAHAADWPAEREDPPAPKLPGWETPLAVRLRDVRPGRYAVTLEAPERPPVRFALHVTEIPIVGHRHSGQALRLGVGDRFILDKGFGYAHRVRVWLTGPAVLELLQQRDDGRPPADVPRREIRIWNEYRAIRPGRATLWLDAKLCGPALAIGCTLPDLGMQLEVEVR
jgi:hypothetical protein